jgi:hypothetical protein
MSVLDWPSYLLQRIPTELRAAISDDAREHDLSVADTVRSVLCAHYSLDCPPRGSGYNDRGTKDAGAERLVLRVQPELFNAIKADCAQGYGKSMRATILEILEAHYQEAPA